MTKVILRMDQVVRAKATPHLDQIAMSREHQAQVQVTMSIIIQKMSK